MRLHGLLLLFCVSAASLATVGCAGETDEDTATAEGALTEYEGVKRSGTKVKSETTPTDAYSARTRLVGYIASAEVDDVQKQLLSVAQWTSIKSAEGDKPFEAASVKSDTTSGATRTVNGKVTLQGDVPLEIRAIAKAEDGKTTVRIANTTGYKHWLAGKILEPGKLTIDVKLVELDGGVIVDATMTVKLEQMEDKAPPFCAALPMVFDWLKAKVSR